MKKVPFMAPHSCVVILQDRSLLRGLEGGGQAIYVNRSSNSSSPPWSAVQTSAGILHAHRESEQQFEITFISNICMSAPLSLT